jgi:2-polyprenyl-3-methyl-5-hydroxy-6-metoxy-1,4-benzoquinol methylase
MKTEVLKNCNLCQSIRIELIDKKNDLCQCKDCGYFFNSPRPVFEEISKFYSKSDKYDFWMSGGYDRDRLWEKRFRKVKKYKKTGALLDIGAGIGQFLNLAKGDFQVAGTEVSESAVAIAKSKYGIDLLKGEMEHMDFGKTKFDVITLFHVLEHVPNPSLTINKCKALLNKNGIIIIAVPNDICSYQAILRNIFFILKIGKWGKRGKFGLPKLVLDGSLDEIHLSHFTPRVLETFFIKNGFLIIDFALDPFYPVKNYRKIIDDACYIFFLIIKKIFIKNFYNTIWLAVKMR